MGRIKDAGVFAPSLFKSRKSLLFKDVLGLQGTSDAWLHG